MLTQDLQEYHDYIKIFKRIRKIESLYAMRNYSCHIIQEIKKPIDTTRIELNKEEFDNNPIFTKAIFRCENFVRDILAYGETRYSEDNLCQRKRLAKARNNNRTLEWKITELISHEYWDKKIIHSFFILAHDQFTYQSQNLYNTFCKYFWIYSEANIAKYIENELWISIKAIYAIWLSYFGLFWKFFEVNEISQLKDFCITENDNKIFHKLFSCELSEIWEKIKKIKEESKYEDILYAGKRCLADTPLYKIWNKKIICPLPHMLIYRITSGITYKFTWKWEHDWTFGKLLWAAFEQFIWWIVNEHNKDKIRTTVEWEKWGWIRDADRFIKEDENLFIIECKARKLTNQTKSTLSTTDSLEYDIKIIVDALIQSYESSLEQNLQKKFWKKTIFKSISCIVVLLEETFIRLIESFSDNPYAEILKTKLKEKLIEKAIDEKDFYSREYLVLSSTDFEILTQAAKKISFKEIIDWKKKKYPWLFWIKWFIDEEYWNKIDFEKPFYNEKVLTLMDEFIKNTNK